MIAYALLLANYLGPGLFGLYTGHLSIVLLFSFVINWGFDTYFLFRSGSFQSRLEVNSFNGKIVFTKMILGLFWITGLTFIAYSFDPNFFRIDLLLLISVDTLLESVFLTQLTALNIKKETQALSFLLFFSRVARLVGGFVLVFFGISSIASFFVIRLIATLIFTLYSIVVSGMRLSIFKFKIVKNIWRSSVSYGLSETMALIYAQVDISLLAILLGEVETGLYTTSSRLIIALFSIPNAGYALVIPRLRDIYLSNKQQFVKYYFKIQIGFLILGLALFGGVFISGKWLVSLILIEEYSISGELLQVLSVVLLLKSLNFGFGALLVSLGWQKIRLIPQLITALMAITLNIIFIPRFGLFGAAYVYIASETILLMGYALLAIIWFRRRRVNA